MKPQAVAKRMVRTCERLWKEGDQALALAKDAQSPLRARDYSKGRGATGDVSDQTGDVGSARAERPVTRKGGLPYGRYVKALRALELALADVDGCLDDILVIPDPEEAKKKRQPAGAGYCMACDEPVTGCAEDRLKAGFCGTCYSEIRETGETREEFLTRKKRECNSTG